MVPNFAAKMPPGATLPTTVPTTVPLLTVVARLLWALLKVLNEVMMMFILFMAKEVVFEHGIVHDVDNIWVGGAALTDDAI